MFSSGDGFVITDQGRIGKTLFQLLQLIFLPFQEMEWEQIAMELRLLSG